MSDGQWAVFAFWACMMLTMIAFDLGKLANKPKQNADSLKAPMFDLHSVPLAPGDVIVLTTSQVIDDETARRLKEIMEQKLAGNPCLVLGEGLKMGVMHRCDVGGVPKAAQAE